MQQVIKFDERLLAAVTELQPVGLVEFTKIAQRVDAISLADSRGANTHNAILDALGLDVSLGVGFGLGVDILDDSFHLLRAVKEYFDGDHCVYLIRCAVVVVYYCLVAAAYRAIRSLYDFCNFSAVYPKFCISAYNVNGSVHSLLDVLIRLIRLIRVRLFFGQRLQWREVCQFGVDDVHGHAEGFGYLLDGDVGHVRQFAVFDAPDVLPGESGTVGQFLLTDALPLAQGSDTLPDALCVLFLVHNCT